MADDLADLNKQPLQSKTDLVVVTYATKGAVYPFAKRPLLVALEWDAVRRR